jgi:hypothetical protein
MVDLAVRATLTAPQVEGVPVDLEGFLALGLVLSKRFPAEVTERTDVVRVDGDGFGHIFVTAGSLITLRTTDELAARPPKRRKE